MSEFQNALLISYVLLLLLLLLSVGSTSSDDWQGRDALCYVAGSGASGCGGCGFVAGSARDAVCGPTAAGAIGGCCACSPSGPPQSGMHIPGSALSSAGGGGGSGGGAAGGLGFGLGPDGVEEGWGCGALGSSGPAALVVDPRTVTLEVDRLFNLM